MSIAHVDTGTLITKIPVNSPTFSIAWHPKRYLLAYACDDKDKYGKSYPHYSTTKNIISVPKRNTSYSMH